MGIGIPSLILAKPELHHDRMAEHRDSDREARASVADPSRQVLGPPDLNAPSATPLIVRRRGPLPTHGPRETIAVLPRWKELS
jgi:hypothetical protein